MQLTGLLQQLVLLFPVGQFGRFFFRGLRLLVPLLLSSSFLDHDAVPLHQAGAQHSQSPIDAVMGGDGSHRGTNLSSALCCFAQFKNNSQKI
jgi:hypothetical protein